MAYPIRVGVQCRPQHTDYATMRDTWLRAEEAGVDALFTWDHFFPLCGDPDGAHFECWTVLGGDGRGDRAAADRRPRHLQLLPQPRPAGRHGAHRRPHLRRPADPRHRRRLVRARLRRVRVRRSARRPTGCATSDAALPRDPQPAGQRSTRHRCGPVPIMIGGEGPKVTLRLTAEHAAIWHGFGAPEEWAAVERDPRRLVREARPRPGRDRALGVGAATIPRPHRRLREGRRDAAGGRVDGPDFDLSAIERLVEYRDAQ